MGKITCACVDDSCIIRCSVSVMHARTNPRRILEHHDFIIPRFHSAGKEGN